MSNPLKQFVRSVREKVWIPRNLLYCSWKGVVWNPSWRFLGLPYFFQAGANCIRIGERLTACSQISKNDLGVNQRVVLRVVRPDAVIEIGDDVGISGATVCAQRRVSIGSRTMIGRGVIISDSDSHPIHPDHRRNHSLTAVAEIRIGENVFIGANAIILKGVCIEEGAVIGAGAVVAKDVPSYAIVVGNPARVIGDCRDQKFIPEEGNRRHDG
ncbi:acyltransferase [Coraliomargarita akajimensis]|uniref:Transferase hexapeptide repeat containing protein n=1 Tax=Coraliomargarita akajimensis (strain DSM 45221 / IAM 15411 / JCM 23193 / KCTC 12865 / 04OKA010-24) TaxID=583355 RepID=D5EML3_CORAD|nr:acyltransferase [Coraliomargarita akajimensis]ADE53419.1 transferase hexapeptide repeat containing protein [Coraliomargarita akajimensis DSM 45221]